MPKKLVFITALLATVLSISSAQAVPSPSEIPAILDQLLISPALSNPAMILIDEKTGEVIYRRNADTPRIPASVMKILTGAAVYEYLDPASSFNTTVSVGNSPKSLVIQGSLDPWFSIDNTVAVKMHRTSLPRIGFTSMKALKAANKGSLRGITIYCNGLFSNDVAFLKSFWAKHGFRPAIKSVSPEITQSHADLKILDSNSPTIEEILKFTLLNSDNLLAERLARLSSRAAGHPFDDKGVAITFASFLEKFNIDSSELVVADGSGLSKRNRITATIMGQLLINLRKDPKFAALYSDLPVSGVSGTLKDRFSTTAPNAVGLVHAKTGTLNGTVNLAGYVQSTDREYVFVTLADKIPKGTSAELKARAAIDKLLGRIAAPNIDAEISNAGNTTP